MCATQHGKDQHVSGPFFERLGAVVFAAEGLDTDRFGTFSGEVARWRSPLETARAKISEAWVTSATSYGIATEGTFSAGWGMAIEHHELMMFIDRDRGIEIVEQTSQPLALPAGLAAVSEREAAEYCVRLGFPEQGVIVRTSAGVHVELRDLAEVLNAVRIALKHGRSVTLEPDFRAHRCPARARVIAALADRVARRLATPCPACQAPGFGPVRSEHGLQCRTCGSRTALVTADIWGCACCVHTDRRSRDAEAADPRWCEACNP